LDPKIHAVGIREVSWVGIQGVTLASHIAK
jgi:hypothetical protein